MRRLRICLVSSCLLAASAAAAAPLPVLRPQQELGIGVGRGVLVNLPQTADAVFVADPRVASFQVPQSNRLLVFGRKPGVTTIYALGADGAVIYSANVDVNFDTEPMLAALKRDFPQLSLQLSPVPDGVAVSGLVPDPQTSAQVIALLDGFVQLDPADAAAQSSDTSSGSGQQGGGGGGGSGGSSGGGGQDRTGVGRGTKTLGARNGKVLNRLTVTLPNQVTIRVRIAEVNRTLHDKLGFRWNLSGNRIGAAESSITFGSTVGQSADVAGLIDALAEEKLISVLAEPNLSVVSGETASFLAGGQIPFQVLRDDQVGIEFKDFGVLLDITPTVLSAQRISLKVRPEVSEPNDSIGTQVRGTTLPGFSVRRAESTVELASGQSFALAGLLQNTLSNQVAKIPGLGDIPFLGALARSKEFQRGETELVIIATAYIAQPANAPLSLPNGIQRAGSPVGRMLMDGQPEIGPAPLADGFIY